MPLALMREVMHLRDPGLLSLKKLYAASRSEP